MIFLFGSFVQLVFATEVHIVRLGEDLGHLNKTTVANTVVAAQCPTCFTFDKEIYFDSIWSMRRYLPAMCSDVKPKSDRDHLCRDMWGWLRPQMKKKIRKSVPIEELKRIIAFLQQQEIPFEAVENGCHVKAHLIALTLEEAAVDSRKIFVEDDDDMMELVTPWRDVKVIVGNPGAVRFHWHVAPLVSAIMPDGKIQEMVIDISFFNEPQPIERWLTRFLGSGCPKLSPGEWKGHRGCAWTITEKYTYMNTDIAQEPKAWINLNIQSAYQKAQELMPIARRRRESK